MRFLLAALLVSGVANANTIAFTGTYAGASTTRSTCATTYNISGQEPSAAGTYPVFIYLVGTSETYTNAAATAAVQGMADRGFVAATLGYASSQFGNCAAIAGKAKCVFDPTSAKSAVSALCARAKAECNKGIAVAGFSQGSIMAMLAKNTDARVRAVYGMGAGVKYSIYDLSSCVANGTRSLTSDHLRAVDGEVDMFLGPSQSGVQSQLQQLTGSTCPAGSYACTQANGSGWQIVQNAQVQDGSADHCYMRDGGTDCTASQNTSDAGWLNGTASWALSPSLDWLASFAGP
ncbi:MAG: hypothetical protein ACJ79H_21015 [Myxococcales bacterium]